jgi:transposase
MAKAYSDDLRRKVLDAIEWDGIKKSEASELFNVSRNPIHLWLHRKAETGEVKVKLRQSQRQNH